MSVDVLKPQRDSGNVFLHLALLNILMNDPDLVFSVVADFVAYLPPQYRHKFMAEIKKEIKKNAKR